MKTTEVNKGYFIELVNRSSSRVVFSAATGDISPEAFKRLWDAVGENIFKLQGIGDRDRWSQFELRITPITDWAG